MIFDSAFSLPFHIPSLCCYHNNPLPLTLAYPGRAPWRGVEPSDQKPPHQEPLHWSLFFFQHRPQLNLYITQQPVHPPCDSWAKHPSYFLQRTFLAQVRFLFCHCSLYCLSAQLYCSTIEQGILSVKCIIVILPA